MPLGVPVGERDAARPRPDGLRVGEVAADREPPRHGDQRGGGPVVVAGGVGGRRAVPVQGLAERDGLHRGDGHALSVDRVEAADRRRRAVTITGREPAPASRRAGGGWTGSGATTGSPSGSARRDQVGHDRVGQAARVRLEARRVGGRRVEVPAADRRPATGRPRSAGPSRPASRAAARAAPARPASLPARRGRGGRAGWQ